MRDAIRCKSASSSPWQSGDPLSGAIEPVLSSINALPRAESGREPAVARMVVEVTHSVPPKVTFKDYHSGRVLISVEDETTEAILDETGETLQKGLAELTQSLSLATGQPRRQPTVELSESSASTTSGANMAIPLAESPPAGNTNISPAASPAERKRGRRKLWDLPGKLHCPVIGTCLGMSELRDLVKRTGLPLDPSLSDYDLHLSFVAASGSKNLLSHPVQKLLERKFAAHIRQFAQAKEPERLLSLWGDALAEGQVAGGFWAVLTHPRCDPSVTQQAYADVHMLSHQIGAGQRADLRRLRETRTELSQLKRELAQFESRSRRQLESRDTQIQHLQASLAKREAEADRQSGIETALRQQLEQLRSSSDHDEMMRLTRRNLWLAEQHTLARAEYERSEQERAALREQVERLEIGLAEKTAECLALERLVAGYCQEDVCHGSCSTLPNLGGRRILCVGGRLQLVEQYRALVDRCNGELDHHDGGLEESRQRLTAQLTSADAVLCMTDCVSHDASHRVKRICKRHDKPYQFVHSSGLSSFARALEAVAE